MLKETTKNRWKFAIIPAVIIALGIIMFIVHQAKDGSGFNFDVEFMGGTRLSVDLGTTFNNDDIVKLVQEATPDKNVSATVQKGNTDTEAIIKVPAVSDDKNEETKIINSILLALNEEYGEAAKAAKEKANASNEAADTTEAADASASPEAAAEVTASPEATVEAEASLEATDEAVENGEDAEAASGEAVAELTNADLDITIKSKNNASASFGAKVQGKALLFALIAIICILIYIIIRFNWMNAVMAVVALAINVFIMASVYTITYIPLNTTFIAAMLTVIGYSINNTIVIFDRIRENQKARRKNESIFEMTDRSINETLGRTINSTITTLITIVLIFILGVSTIKEFALPLIVGIIAGAYTSIFLASTFWAAWKESSNKAKALEAQERRAGSKSNYAAKTSGNKNNQNNKNSGKNNKNNKKK